jgi:integral membrane sensor domain MASE1
MKDGRVRYEVLIASILLVVSIVSLVLAYFMVSGQIALFDLSRLDVRGSMQNLAFLLTLLSFASLFMGAVIGWLFGKYLRAK